MYFSFSNSFFLLEYDKLFFNIDFFRTYILIKNETINSFFKSNKMEAIQQSFIHTCDFFVVIVILNYL